MFPNPNNSPSLLAQCASDGPVPLGIASDLPLPVVLIGGGLAAVSRAAMPEAAIDKDRDSLSRETEIRGAENGILSPPA